MDKYIIKATSEWYVASVEQMGANEVSVRATEKIEEAQVFPDHFSQRILAVRQKCPDAIYLKVTEETKRIVHVVEVIGQGGE